MQKVHGHLVYTHGTEFRRGQITKPTMQTYIHRKRGIFAHAGTFSWWFGASGKNVVCNDEWRHSSDESVFYFCVKPKPWGLPYTKPVRQGEKKSPKCIDTLLSIILTKTETMAHLVTTDQYQWRMSMRYPSVNNVSHALFHFSLNKGT